MRLIDADALEKDYREQFESVYRHTRDTVLPSDFYIERIAAYNKELVRTEMEAFFEYLRSRPTIDAEPVRHGRWIHDINNIYGCSECAGRETMSPKKLKNYCSNCGAKMMEVQDD